MKALRILLIVLSIMLAISCVACNQPTDSVQETTDQVTTTEPTTSETDEQTTTEQEEIQVKLPREIDERYFIYRIWNFTPQSQAKFEATVDAAAETGFNAIKVHIPWSRVETVAGLYDYSAFDPMIEYVVKTKGLKIAISVDLTRRADDNVIALDQMQYDPQGNLCKGGSIDGMRTVISFCSESAVSSAVAFYTDLVNRYDALYADDVLFYLPAFTQYAESEYWPAGEYDYGPLAKQAFRVFLQEKYESIEEFCYVTGLAVTSFEQIDPPSCTDSSNFGQLWYQFRHQKLKAFIDALALSQKQARPNSKFALQFGGISDSASAVRCTLAAASLAEHADVVWIDDGPNTDHEFSMDHANATFPSNVLLAQEIDGPHQTDATPEKYLDQGMDSWGRGCTYVSIANWDIDSLYRTYEWVWKQLATTWLGADTPDVIDTTREDLTMEIKLSDMLRKANSASFINRYYSIAINGEFVCISIVDDLTDKKIDQPSKIYSFPSGFSKEQGKNGWYYMSYHHKSGKFYEMSFDEANGRWQGKSTYSLVMNGSMHPDQYDSALVFRAPINGTVTYRVTASLTSRDGDGVAYSVLKNGQPITVGEDKGFVYLATGEVADLVLEIEVSQGDEIAFVLNVYKTSAFDATEVSVTVEYN